MADNTERLPIHLEALELYRKLKLAYCGPQFVGWFKEFYNSALKVDRKNADSTVDRDRKAITSIYFLQDSTCKPKWRRLKSDELIVWLKGDPVNVYILNDEKELETITLGDVLVHSQVTFQVGVPAGSIFTTEVGHPNSYALVAAAVGPGWEMDDFCIPDEDVLIETFPQHEKIIRKFC